MPQILNLKKGSVVYISDSRADRIFVLKSGRVILSHDSVGVKEKSVLAGSFFGERVFFAGVPHEDSATCAEDSVVIAFSASEFGHLFGLNRDVILRMLKICARDIRAEHRSIERALGSGAIRQGMLFSLVQSYFSEELWLTCADFCKKYANLAVSDDERKKLCQMEKDARKKISDGVLSGLSDAALLDNARNGKKSKLLIAAEKRFELSGFASFERNYPSGRVLLAEFAPGDTFFVLLKGIVRLAKKSSDGNVTISRLVPGDIFGAVAALDGSPQPASCIALTNVEVLEFSREHLAHLVGGNARFSLLLLRAFYKRFFVLKRRIHTMELSNMTARIADFFLMLDEENAEIDDETPLSSKREFLLTEPDVARWTGLSHAEAHTELLKFIKNGSLEFTERTAFVDISEMQRIVRGANLVVKRREQLLESVDRNTPEKLLRAIL